jgi:hypothetical protein
MKPEDFNDPGTEAADRKDNRTAIVVAVCAAIVVGVASGILMATAGQTPQAMPTPTHSSIQYPGQAQPTPED